MHDQSYFMILGLHDQCIFFVFIVYSLSFDNLSVVKDVRLYFVSFISPNLAELVLEQAIAIISELLECFVGGYFALD